MSKLRKELRTALSSQILLNQKHIGKTCAALHIS
nr:MAG TPA: hypothetical protein [Caudoviricetes sp.]